MWENSKYPNMQRWNVQGFQQAGSTYPVIEAFLIDFPTKILDNHDTGSKT